MADQAPFAIVGLGNPGAEYERTRHNAGFWFAEHYAARHHGSFRREAKFFGDLARIRVAGADVLLLKPQTFMNRSGQAVSALAQFYKVPTSQILVAHDELDLPAGTVRLKFGGGHGGHNGLRDIHKPLGADYRRLRIGIGHPGDKNLVLNYVLGRPSKADEDAIRDGIARAAEAVDLWLSQSWDKALQQLHTAA
jgi:PTH1 family peptidyl-tRNA hydrolase